MHELRLHIDAEKVSIKIVSDTPENAIKLAYSATSALREVKVAAAHPKRDP